MTSFGLFCDYFDPGAFSLFDLGIRAEAAREQKTWFSLGLNQTPREETHVDFLFY